MNPSILDTDTLSYVMDGRFEDMNAVARQYIRVFGRFSVSAITIAEVVKGLRRSPAGGDPVQRFIDFSQGFEVFPIFREEAIVAGEILGALSLKGLPIGSLDPFIAATAIVNDRVLVTNNVRHYERIIEAGFNLRLTNWRT